MSAIRRSGMEYSHLVLVPGYSYRVRRGPPHRGSRRGTQGSVAVLVREYEVPVPCTPESARTTSAERAPSGALGSFLTSYNTTRPHTAHGRKPPMSRLTA